jgi:hypothetical protein
MDPGRPMRMMRKANGNSIECVGYAQNLNICRLSDLQNEPYPASIDARSDVRKTFRVSGNLRNCCIRDRPTLRRFSLRGASISEARDEVIATICFLTRIANASTWHKGAIVMFALALHVAQAIGEPAVVWRYQASP